MALRSRPAPLDSGLQQLDGAQRKYVRFDPTLNTGHVLQIAVLVIGGFMAYTAVKTEQAETRANVRQVEAQAITDRSSTKDALADLKTDIKELQKSTGEIKESLAILRGRAADTGGRK